MKYTIEANTQLYCQVPHSMKCGFTI